MAWDYSGGNDEKDNEMSERMEKTHVISLQFDLVIPYSHPGPFTINLEIIFFCLLSWMPLS